MATVNTGYQEKLQKDVNPNSPTLGQTRWVSAGLNLTACPRPQIFYSDEIRQTVYRDDCGAGNTSTGVIYTVASGYSISPNSKEEANALARAYFDLTSQPYARANATCQAGGTGGTVEVRNCIYDGSGCWTGSVMDGYGNQLTTSDEDCIRCNQGRGINCPEAVCA